MVTALTRILKFGFRNFRRNGLLSVATIAVMALSILVLYGLLVLNAVSRTALASLEDKIDISAYFVSGTPEAQIQEVEAALGELSEVARVEYVSETRALEVFRAEHKDDPTIEQALAELEGNPLLASLNIKATAPDKYAAIAEFLESENLKPIVEKVTFRQNQLVIERLSRILDTFRAAGLGITVVLALIAALITFNTIRLAIYSNREELGIMRLVGASNRFVSGPYVVTGLIYGALSAVIGLLIFIPLVALIAPYVAVLIPEMQLGSYFTSHAFRFLGLGLLFGMVLGALSSFIAARKYLKI